MKKWCFLILPALILIMFIPLPAADMTIRIHLAEMVGDNYVCYYSQNRGVFTPEQMVAAEMDYERNQLAFHFDGSLEGLAALRLDFPNAEELICIENITVSSAGIIQKQFNPSVFFAKENLMAVNDIEAISPATAQDKCYFLTGGPDPYIILSDELVAAIDSGYSHLTLSRFGIFLFAAGCLFFAHKNYFALPQNKK